MTERGLHWNKPGRLKLVYISLFIALAATGLMGSVMQLIQFGLRSPWLGAAIACAAPIIFFWHVYAHPTVCVSRKLTLLLIAGTSGAWISLILAGGAVHLATIVAAVVCILGEIAHNFWHSCFPVRATSTALRRASVLEDLDPPKLPRVL